jgi:hypothetical protein
MPVSIINKIAHDLSRITSVPGTKKNREAINIAAVPLMEVFKRIRDTEYFPHGSLLSWHNLSACFAIYKSLQGSKHKYLQDARGLFTGVPITRVCCKRSIMTINLIIFRDVLTGAIHERCEKHSY